MKDLETTTLEEEEVNLLLPELQEYAWQAREVTWTEQVLHILKKAKWTDCTFEVGTTKERSKVFRCHRVLLAKSSAVFEKMLFGLLKEQGEVRITDVEPAVFQNLLEFLYTGELHLQDENRACDVFVAADKYLVLELRQRCLDFMLGHVTPRFAPRALGLAKLMNLEDLKVRAWQTILERTDEVVLTEEFLSAPRWLLHELVGQEALHLISEAELISACQRWALRESGSSGRPRDTSLVREALGPVFSLLRFCSLSVAEFTAGPLKYNMLTSDEKVELLSRISDGASCQLEGFCTDTRRRAEYRQPVPHFTFSHELNNAAIESADGVFCTFSMTVDCPVLVCGLRTATKIGRCYVTIQNEEGQCLTAGRYDTNQACTTGGRVEFEPAVSLQPEQPYRVMLSSEGGQCLLATGRNKEARNLYSGMNLAGNDYSFVPLIRYVKS